MPAGGPSGGRGGPGGPSGHGQGSSGGRGGNFGGDARTGGRGRSAASRGDGAANAAAKSAKAAQAKEARQAATKAKEAKASAATKAKTARTAVNAAISALGLAPTKGLPTSADRTASGDPTSQGFGSTQEGRTATIGRGLANLAKSDRMGFETRDIANEVFGSLPSDISKQEARNEANLSLNSPNLPALKTAFNFVSPVPFRAVEFAADALNNLSNVPPGFSVSESETGGGGDRSSNTTVDILKDLNMANTDTGSLNVDDLLAQLQGGGSGEGNISFNVGNQEVSIMPKAKRDELALLLDYLRIQQGGDQLAFERDQAQPSFIDKGSQLLGLGSDAVGLWQGVSSMFG